MIECRTFLPALGRWSWGRGRGGAEDLLARVTGEMMAVYAGKQWQLGMSLGRWPKYAQVWKLINAIMICKCKFFYILTVSNNMHDILYAVIV